MTNRIHTISRSRAKGVTLIEILLVIGLLAIVASFAVPSMSSATASAEMKAAVENVEYSIRTARNTARLKETGIAIEISQATPDTAAVIDFSDARDANRAIGIAQHQLPEGIDLLSRPAAFEFDKRGLVIEPGTITLVSRADNAVTATIEVR